AHTPAAVNHRIDALMRARVEETIERGRDAVIRRIAELDTEWDVDRALMANFAVVGGAAFAGGLARYTASPRNKGLLFLFGAQLGFLLLHSTVGWCPPVGVLRRLGVRTSREIAFERQVLHDSLDANQN
ncbi:MAG TPA: hypothetical protein VK524_17360, partial [Polyangiaceae bacterium]|nr:hypothetical protein [Polyangiaceae bacterium]